MLEGKILFVCVDSDEDTYLMVADEAAVEEYYDAHPNADRFEVSNAVGRELTEEEQGVLPEILGALAY